MKYKYFYLVGVVFIIISSCKNSTSPLPENNNFSYLEINANNKIDEDTNISNITDYSNLICFKKHSEIKGNLITSDVKIIQNSQSLTKKMILNLGQPFTLECNDNKKISSNYVILNFENDRNMELYLGNMVLVIGEISKTQGDNNKFPLEMNVIRLQPI